MPYNSITDKLGRDPDVTYQMGCRIQQLEKEGWSVSIELHHFYLHGIAWKQLGAERQFNRICTKELMVAVDVSPRPGEVLLDALIQATEKNEVFVHTFQMAIEKKVVVPAQPKGVFYTVIGQIPQDKNGNEVGLHRKVKVDFPEEELRKLQPCLQPYMQRYLPSFVATVVGYSTTGLLQVHTPIGDLFEVDPKTVERVEGPGS